MPFVFVSVLPSHMFVDLLLSVVSNYKNFENVEGERNIAQEHRRRVLYQVNLRIRLRDTINPFDVSVPQFKKFYRLPQHLVFELTDLIRPYIGGHTQRIPLCVRVLCALAFYASGSYQGVVGCMAYLNLSQATVSKILDDVTRALNHPDIMTRMIHFPTTRAEREIEIQRNAGLKLPRVLGLIDGTIIKIVPPLKGENRRPYMCRKGYYAINVQIVCSSNLYIFDVNARFPGSSNDPYIYTASGVQEEMRVAYEESRCWLLGDSIYPLEPWLHTPIPNAEPETPEFLYTQAHCSSRNPVERCNGVLKGRWRCLHWDRTLHYTPQKAGLIVNACVVLHNFCRQRNVEDPPPELEPRRRDHNGDHDDEDMDFPQDAGILRLRQRALQERRFLIDYVVRRHGAQDE